MLLTSCSKQWGNGDVLRGQRIFFFIYFFVCEASSWRSKPPVDRPSPGIYGWDSRASSGAREKVRESLFKAFSSQSIAESLGWWIDCCIFVITLNLRPGNTPGKKNVISSQRSALCQTYRHTLVLQIFQTSLEFILLKLIQKGNQKCRVSFQLSRNKHF